MEEKAPHEMNLDEFKTWLRKKGTKDNEGLSKLGRQLHDKGSSKNSRYVYNYLASKEDV